MHLRRLSMPRRTTTALASGVALLLLAATPGSGLLTAQATGENSPPRTVATMKGPRGLDVGPGGKLYVARANGTFGIVVRSGPRRGTVRVLGRVPRGLLAPALDVNGRGEVYVLTVVGEGGAKGGATLYRWTRGGGREKVADIAAYQRGDTDPFDLEKKPRDSNPYGVYALDEGGALVADAGGNDLLRVSEDGEIETVARVKPRRVKVPKGLGPKAPPAGTTVPSEAVITSVTVGSDGAYYIGELRGFPATPRTSQIWRVEPDATDAVCRPRHPHRGDCRVVVRNLTSVVALEGGRGGSLYAVQLSDKSWLKAEAGSPAASIGSLIRIGRDRSVRHELVPGALVLPGDVALGRRGAVFVTSPIFGKGSVFRVR